MNEQAIITIKVKGYKKSQKKLKKFLKTINQINEALEKSDSMINEEPVIFILENLDSDSTEEFWNKV